MLTSSVLQNQKGLAVFEIVPILVLFALLLNFALGFFGVIHSGILNSIASRNYAFETFRNRANLNYIRDVEDDGIGAASEVNFYYMKDGYRYHGTVSESKTSNEDWFATVRAIKFSDHTSPLASDGSVHNRKVAQVTSGQRASDVIDENEFTSVWVRTLYGICLNKTCGD